MTSSANLPGPVGVPARARPREIWAWAMYDWANSAYTTLSITVMVNFLVYFVFDPAADAPRRLTQQAAAWGRNVEPRVWGEAIWALGLAGAMFTAALLSPVVGAMADARATKRWWLAGTALGGAVCPLIMFFVPTDYVWTLTALFMTASMLFDLSFGFYNGFLPELADEKSTNRVSAWGFALGYLGGGLALTVQVLVFQFGDRWGIVGIEQQLRVGLLIMGLWWGFFTLPAIIFLRDKTPPGRVRKSFLRTGREAFGQVRHTLRNVRKFPMLALFLLAFLFYNDGIQTVIGQSPVFAKSELGMEPQQLLPLILAFQFVCLLGALIDSFLTDRIGQKRAILIYLAVWLGCLGTAYFVETPRQFWMLSFALGLVMGGAQTVSRSIMARMTPQRHTAEFFGFFNFSGKATAWMGNLTFGAVILANHTARTALLSLFVFFVIGYLLVLGVNIPRGQQEAAAADAESPPA